MKALIRNGIGFWGPDREVRPMHILVDGDTIVQVSAQKIAPGSGAIVSDVGGRLLPGFVDAHTHLAQSFGRGIYDNRHLTQWLLTLMHHFGLSAEETYMGRADRLHRGAQEWHHHRGGDDQRWCLWRRVRD
jgi:cytosine/adenosine deaminase-related metal-dependent hydrolase